MGSCHLLVDQPIGGQLTDGLGAGVTADDVGGRTQGGLGVESHLVLLAGIGYPFGCFILRMDYLILSYFIYFVLVSLYTFSSCSSHIVKYFFILFYFFKFLHPEYAS